MVAKRLLPRTKKVKLAEAKDSLLDANLKLALVHKDKEHDALKGCLQCLNAAIGWLERYERETSE